jgi:Protein of unknown function (DUF402)
MPFEPGRTVLRRYFRGSRYTYVQPMRVISDDDAGLLLWTPAGSEFAVLRDADGRSQHDLPIDEMSAPRLVRKTWRDNDILVLRPHDGWHSIWWFFENGGFVGWYVNLETPGTRHENAIDLTDLVLDVWVEPDRTWEWKDEDEMAARIGNPAYFDAEQAAAVRAEGERLIKLAEAGAFPFDGTHVDFRPDPRWPIPALPDDWDSGAPGAVT